MVLRRDDKDIVRTGSGGNRQGTKERTVQATRHAEQQTSVSSSHDTMQRAVIIRPRTIWLVAAIIAGLAVGWVVVGRSLDVWALLFIGIVLAEGMRPLVHGLCARGLPRSIAVLLLYGAMNLLSYFDPLGRCYISLSVDLLEGDRAGLRRAITSLKRDDRAGYRHALLLAT